MNRVLHGLARLTEPRFARSHLIGTLDQVLAAQHLTYAEMELLGLLPPGDGAIRRRFAVCRNPFDRAVSSVSHFGGKNGAPANPAEFERALAAWLDRDLHDHNERAHRRPQADYIRDKRGDIAVEAILRFETLGKDFSALMAEMGLTGIDLPWHGPSARSRDYRDYFTQEARRRVETEFKDDLEAFSYSF